MMLNIRTLRSGVLACALAYGLPAYAFTDIYGLWHEDAGEARILRSPDGVEFHVSYGVPRMVARTVTVRWEPIDYKIRVPIEIWVDGVAVAQVRESAPGSFVGSTTVNLPAGLVPTRTLNAQIDLPLSNPSVDCGALGAGFDHVTPKHTVQFRSAEDPDNVFWQHVQLHIEGGGEPDLDAKITFPDTTFGGTVVFGGAWDFGNVIPEQDPGPYPQRLECQTGDLRWLDTQLMFQGNDVYNGLSLTAPDQVEGSVSGADHTGTWDVRDVSANVDAAFHEGWWNSAGPSVAPGALITAQLLDAPNGRIDVIAGHGVNPSQCQVSDGAPTCAFRVSVPNLSPGPHQYQLLLTSTLN